MIFLLVLEKYSGHWTWMGQFKTVIFLVIFDSYFWYKKLKSTRKMSETFRKNEKMSGTLRKTENFSQQNLKVVFIVKCLLNLSMGKKVMKLQLNSSRKWKWTYTRWATILYENILTIPPVDVVKLSFFWWYLTRTFDRKN